MVERALIDVEVEASRAKLSDKISCECGNDDDPGGEWEEWKELEEKWDDVWRRKVWQPDWLDARDEHFVRFCSGECRLGQWKNYIYKRLEKKVCSWHILTSPPRLADSPSPQPVHALLTSFGLALAGPPNAIGVTWGLYHSAATCAITLAPGQSNSSSSSS